MTCTELGCPWHGWDFDPLTGKPPGGFDDGVALFEVAVRADGVYVGLGAERPPIQVDFDAMALGLRVTDPDGLDNALSRALSHPAPSLVEIVSDPDLIEP